MPIHPGRDRGRRHDAAPERLTCPCGWSTRACLRPLRRSGGAWIWAPPRLYLRAEIRRLHCRRCGRVRTEAVPWARPGARFTRDFEDVVAWLAQRMDKTAITRLLRCSWEAVAGIVTRVVADHLDDARLDAGLPDRRRRGLLPQGSPLPDRGRRPRPRRRGDLGRRGQVRRDPRAVLRRAREARRTTDPGRAATCTAATRRPPTPAQPRPTPGLRRPVPRDQARQPRRRRGPPRPGTPPRQGRGAGRRPRPRTITGVSQARPRNPPADQAHPMGAAQRPRRTWTRRQREQIAELRRARSRAASAPGCSTRNSATSTGSRPPPTTPISTAGSPGPAAAGSRPCSTCPAPSAAPRPDPRRRRPRPVQQQTRRPELQDQAHQPPRLRPPQRRRRHRDDLPLLLRNHHHLPTGR